MDSLQLTAGEGLGGTGGRQRGWSPAGGIALRLRPAEGWAEPRLMAARREGRSCQLAGRTPCASREAGAAGLGPSARSGDSRFSSTALHGAGRRCCRSSRPARLCHPSRHRVIHLVKKGCKNYQNCVEQFAWGTSPTSSSSCAWVETTNLRWRRFEASLAQAVEPPSAPVPSRDCGIQANWERLFRQTA